MTFSMDYLIIYVNDRKSQFMMAKSLYIGIDENQLCFGVMDITGDVGAIKNPIVIKYCSEHSIVGVT